MDPLKLTIKVVLNNCIMAHRHLYGNLKQCVRALASCWVEFPNKYNSDMKPLTPSFYLSCLLIYRLSSRLTNGR